MAVQYFGETSPGASAYKPDPVVQLSQNTAGTTYTCPAGGLFDVVELKMYCYQEGSTAGNYRLAIYDTSGNLMAQGSSQVAITGASGAWRGHIGAGNISQVSPLTGGQSYLLAFTTDTSASIWVYYKAGASGDYKYANTDYTGGFPSTLSVSSASAAIKSIQCGVEERASGLSIPVVQSIYRRRRL